jgi:gluconolactonase
MGIIKMECAVEPNSQRGLLSRRSLLQATAGMAVMGPALAFGQEAKLGTPPSVITTPPRQWGRGAPPVTYPDPDIIIIDDSFKNYLLGITPIRRVWTGGLWAEGPAWSSQGQYLVFSDVQANVQHRFMWDSRRTANFRLPSNNSNGNSFDFQGRQLSTEDLFRRVIRWENDGSMTVIADSFDGKRLNSPNDLVPHPDGSIWFTDPYYGDSLSEGHPRRSWRRKQPRRAIESPSWRAECRSVGRPEARATGECISLGSEWAGGPSVERRQAARPERPLLLARL